MKKVGWILGIMLLLQSCGSLPDLVPVPVEEPLDRTPLPTFTFSPTPTPTITSTPTPTLTPRNTATLVIFPSLTPVNLAGLKTSTPFPAFAPTLAPPGGGFEYVKLSRNQIFWGVCKANNTRMTIKVEDPEQVRRVYLFYRIESAKKEGDTSPWVGTITDDDGNGIYLYNMRANNIPERGNYLKAWVHFQLVGEDRNEMIIARSQVYTRSLTLQPCP